jgi:hypothetical protein
MLITFSFLGSWIHDGEDMAYFRNTRTYISKRGKVERSRSYYTFSFVYHFQFSEV